MKTLFSTIKEKFAKLKDAARKKFHDVGNWLRQHWNEVITFGPILIAGLSTFIRVGGKRLNLRKEENLKNLYCYDRSLGHY